MPYALEQLDTPFVAVDVDIVEDNLRRMQQQAEAAGLKLRPHTKTHKQPGLAQRQVELGAHGITVAKLDEAEVMLKAGLTDILIAYPLVGRAKAHRLALLMTRGLEPTISLDSLEALKTVALAGQLAGRSVNVLAEVDTGFHRCGLNGSALVELALTIHGTPGVRFGGLMSFAGHISGHRDVDRITRLIDEEDGMMHDLVRQITAHHVPVDDVSVGGTILSHHLQRLRTATEVRPGIYIFNDMGIVTAHAATIDQCAARVWATIVSQPEAHRLVLDSGSKMLSTDGPIDGCYGHIVEHPDWRIVRLSEEHAVVELPPNAAPAAIGSLVSIIPNHICTVMNLQNTVTAVRQGSVVASWPIMARGGTQ